MIGMPEKFSTKILFIVLFYLLVQYSISPLISAGAEQIEREQEFQLQNNETEIFLDIENTRDQYLWNGNISVTLYSGGPIHITVNEQEKSLSIGQTHKFFIINSTTVFFQISVGKSEAQGIYRLDLNLDQPEPDRKLGVIFLLVGGGIMLLAVGYFYVQRKQSMTKPEDEQEPIDEEVRKKRQEAAAAERRYWGEE